MVHFRDVLLLCLKGSLSASPHMTLPWGPGLALTVTCLLVFKHFITVFSIAMTKRDDGSFKRRHLRLTVPGLESHGHWERRGVGTGRHDGAHLLGHNPGEQATQEPTSRDTPQLYQIVPTETRIQTCEPTGPFSFKPPKC